MQASHISKFVCICLFFIAHDMLTTTRIYYLLATSAHLSINLHVDYLTGINVKHHYYMLYCKVETLLQLHASLLA